MSMGTIAERLFDSTQAQREIENMLNIDFEHLGWDEYDGSLGIHGVPPEERLTPDVVAALGAAGFTKVFLNHTDEWETHYTPAKDTDGWRVSYPHKRKGDEPGILVEEVVSTWPPEWFENGKVIVKPVMTDRCVAAGALIRWRRKNGK